jgi:hypothetical protein
LSIGTSIKGHQITSMYSTKKNTQIHPLFFSAKNSRNNKLKWPFLVALTLLIFACQTGDGKKFDHPLAANEEVARYMENFVGRGDLTDPGAQPTDPNETINRFNLADDLQIELVLAEPQIVQPIHISFDHKGRLWVVQYHQYPYPKGLKITDIDNHTRVKFDKSPLAPPEGAQGADKVSVFEDRDGDGKYEHSFDAITGLNIATSVALGRGNIWVLNPPYLLAYPDSTGDGRPTGDPEVHLEGFGLEDTHAVANSLQWGPDGWLYGVQGSTTTANVKSAKTEAVSFLGQAIWRYQPEDQVFELFAEGGGNNPFYLEFDSKGRIFSGSNGYGRDPITNREDIISRAGQTRTFDQSLCIWVPAQHAAGWGEKKVYSCHYGL